MTYPEMVQFLAKSGDEIIKELTPEKIDLLHMAVGISGEAGEIIDAVKKHVVYDRPLDRGNLIEELGDIEFYLQGMRARLGVSREEILDHNMTKLAKRYPTGTFTNADAQARKDKA